MSIRSKLAIMESLVGMAVVLREDAESDAQRAVGLATFYGLELGCAIRDLTKSGTNKLAQHTAVTDVAHNAAYLLNIMSLGVVSPTITAEAVQRGLKGEHGKKPMKAPAPAPAASSSASDKVASSVAAVGSKRRVVG